MIVLNLLELEINVVDKRSLDHRRILLEVLSIERLEFNEFIAQPNQTN